ncbi:MAG: biotin carboxylase, partial [Hymenobacteraceae bacterium]|nr:biotin carboxylase [Hymenobacteraceae bacterium]MDX5397810.1 biotin carboxylase [Hymenobacteraceae bacterium]MDX5513889.1 biotin carboxylase [Hymenobacteraceae bacterium]
EYQITGIETTLPFGTFVLNHEAFVSGNFDTKFIERYFKPEMLKQEATEEETEIAAVLAAVLMEQKKPAAATNGASAQTAVTSNWKKNRLA